MGSSHRDLKARLFKVFSLNFEYVNNNNGYIKFVPAIPDAYMCPICCESFLEDGLSANSAPHLTLEHVPPDSLGGKGTILTCNKCNSISGRTLDKQLLTHLECLDFVDFLPNVKQNRPMTFNGLQINTRFRIDGNGQVNLHLDPKRSNPSIFKQVINEIEKSEAHKNLEAKGVAGTIPLPKTDTRLVEIALLRIAYLSIISTFGYGVFINLELQYVREQILNPEKEILAYPYRIVLKGFEPGIYLVKEPKELHCFLVIFDLKTSSASRRFSVMLPGPTDPGIKIYENFRNIVSQNHNSDHLPMMLEKLPPQKYLSNFNLAFALNRYWQKHIINDSIPK